jgi:hypothetical protein
MKKEADLHPFVRRWEYGNLPPVLLAMTSGLFNKALDNPLFTGFFKVDSQLVAFYGHYGSIAEFLVKNAFSKAEI